MRNNKHLILLRNIALIFLAALWCLASCIEWYIEDQNYRFEAQIKNVASIELTQGNVVSQQILINDRIDNLTFYTANGGGDRAETNKGTIKLTLRQNDIIETCVIDIHGIQDWVYLAFEGKFSQFQSGSAVLEIESIDTQPGSSLYVVYTKDNVYDIPKAALNGESLEGPLCIRYNTGNPGGVDTRTCVLCACILAVVVAVGYIVTRFPKNCLVYCVTVVLAVLIICLKYPSYTINGEVVAEVGALYVPYAENLGFVQNLFTLEQGLYLNIMGRLVSWFSVHCMPSLRVAVSAIDMISVVLVAMMGCALATGALRKYITPLESVLVSLPVTTSLMDAGTIAQPMMAAYWGIFPLLVLLAVIVFRVDITNRLYWFLGGLSLLSTISRMTFVIFIVVLPVVFFLRRKQLKRRDIVFMCAEFFACLLQGVGSLLLRKQQGVGLVGDAAAGSIVLLNPIKLLEQVLYVQVQVVNALFRVQVSEDYRAWNLLLAAIFLGGCIILMRCLLKRKNNEVTVFIAVLVLVSLGQAALQQLSNGFGLDFKGWDKVISLSRSRWFFFNYAAGAGGVLTAFVCFRKSRIYVNESICSIVGTGVLALCMLVMCSVQLKENQPYLYNAKSDVSDWGNYYKMASHETYFIPGAPLLYRWPYCSSDCEMQRGTVAATDIIELNIDTDFAASFYAYKDIRGSQISFRTYYADLYDMDGQLVERVQQVSNPKKQTIGFDFDTPINGISKVLFTYEDDTPAYINGDYLACYRG